MKSLILWVVLANAASDEREIRRQKLNAAVYDPGVIPGKWRRENMNDFENIGAFVTKKCMAYPDGEWYTERGAIEQVHHFSSDRLITIMFTLYQ